VQGSIAAAYDSLRKAERAHWPMIELASRQREEPDGGHQDLSDVRFSGDSSFALPVIELYLCPSPSSTGEKGLINQFGVQSLLERPPVHP
jgi:hypothetical protein